MPRRQKRIPLPRPALPPRRLGALLLLGVPPLLVSSCAGPALTGRIPEGAAARAVFQQPEGRKARKLRRVIVNQSLLRQGTLPPHHRGEISRVFDLDLRKLVTAFEISGFFSVASPSPSQGPGKTLSLHLPTGSWHLASSRDPKVFADCQQIFFHVWNTGFNTIITGSTRGGPAVDFQAEARRLDQVNRDRLNRLLKKERP